VLLQRGAGRFAISMRLGKVLVESEQEILSAITQ
jgi:hypothetical protein